MGTRHARKVAFVTIAAVIAMPALVSASETFKDVVVRNSASQPVPVRAVEPQQVTGTVNLGNQPTVHIGNAPTVGLADNASVRIETTQTEPLHVAPVHTVEDPVQQYVDVLVIHQEEECRPILVSEGRRLRVETIAVDFRSFSEGATFPDSFAYLKLRGTAVGGTVRILGEEAVSLGDQHVSAVLHGPLFLDPPGTTDGTVGFMCATYSGKLNAVVAGYEFPAATPE